MTQDDLDIVNRARRNNGERYIDEEAANIIRGSATKSPLTSSPFEVILEYGAAFEGYWNYDRMVLQMEDCVDVLKVLYPQFDIVFLFDHSCGHDKQRPDGLNANNISKGYGGSQPKMHDTKIQDMTYLGPFANGPHCSLKVGEIQKMVFQEGDDGPFWMNADIRDQMKYDKYLGDKEVDKLKSELAQELNAIGVNSKGNKEKLQERCRNNNTFKKDCA